jgi:Rod binding domain-containing protein
MTIDPVKQHNALVKQTQKWVAQTFYGTLLKQVRESPFKNEMMSGGRGGQAFGSMLDGRLAERMAKSSGSKLVNAIVNKIENAQAIRTSGTKPKRAPRGITTQPFPGGIK